MKIGPEGRAPVYFEEDITARDEGKTVCYCITGALDRAAMRSEPHVGWVELFMWVSKALGFETSRDYATSDNLITWNDKPGRTAEDVIGAVDKAIALVEAEPVEES